VKIKIKFSSNSNYVQIYFNRYIKLDIKLITFASDKDFIGHVKDEIVYSHLMVSSLLELIKDKKEIASNKLTLYQDYRATTGERIGKMDPDKTLEQHGYIGKIYNDLNDADKIVLFFDYRVAYGDDPILNSDFYFHNYNKNNKKGV
jgi:hypothetical protein